MGIKTKYSDFTEGKHTILFITGSVPPEYGFSKSKGIVKILTQFDDDLVYPPLYWYNGDYIFPHVQKIIESQNIDAIVGYSAGGHISYHLSNKYQIPALSLNPAIARTSEAPTLQTVTDDISNSPICDKQLIVIGKNDRKYAGGVDGHLVEKELNMNGFGGKIFVVPGVHHSISYRLFNKSFKYFYEKFLL